MIQISQLKLPVFHTNEELLQKVRKVLRLSSDARVSYTIKKKSLDARKKPDLYYVYTIHVTVPDEQAVKRMVKSNQILFDCRPKTYLCKPQGERLLQHRPVVIGTGPAGLFCGYQLAMMGYRPILLERGASIHERTREVEQFWQTGQLNPDTNVQFGEGGAGTFSDGKLNTLVKDPAQRGMTVLKTLTAFGAPEEILYDSKPHIGTDVLINVVEQMRLAIEAAGGEVRFHSKAEDFLIEEQHGRRFLAGIRVMDVRTGNTSELPAELTVLAIGHSARDTFTRLEERGIPMEAKSFATGVRIEHPQEMIDQDQYGRRRTGSLPAAAYKLTAQASDGRGVYTFCMCPGGYVVNASSETSRLAVNGMSYHDRAGTNANSAVIVTVSPADYGGAGALAGIAFQRRLEAIAYQEGQGAVPVQLFKDFKADVPSLAAGEILPQIKGAYRFANVRRIFPEVINQALVEGIQAFGRKLPGFDRDDAVIAGIESRTSSPVRILRNDSMESSIGGLYPCGEGAGYAGGIMSAAMDGLKTAEAIAKLCAPFDKYKDGLRNF